MRLRGFRLILTCALIVFVADKILSKLVCCHLCSSLRTGIEDSESGEENVRLHESDLDSPRAADCHRVAGGGVAL